MKSSNISRVRFGIKVCDPIPKATWLAEVTQFWGRKRPRGDYVLEKHPWLLQKGTLSDIHCHPCIGAEGGQQ